MLFEKELAIARQAAEMASAEIMRLYADFVAISDAPAEISTEADRRAQEIILRHLAAHFLEDAYCAEEESLLLGKLRRRGPRLWIIDPIDGSRGFARKNGEFSVMIALVQDGEPTLGIVREPARERLTFALRGQGCWSEDPGQSRMSCRVSDIDRLPQARYVRSWSEKPAERQSPAAGLFKDCLFHYSAGIKLALVARGEVEIYTSNYQGFHSWDVCAGQLLVEEAGGRITDVHGKSVAYGDDGAGLIAGSVASNGLLHQAALDLVAGS
jgi:3'(2'), 5'-bisphosphate nucleotidase